jgi:hypothetical protein
MAHKSFQIGGYRLHMRSGSTTAWRWKALLYLYEEKASLPRGGEPPDPPPRATVLFTDERPLPAPTSGRALSMWFAAEMLPNVMDMLRHDKPVYVVYNDPLTLADLATGDEPIGEEEGRG